MKKGTLIQTCHRWGSEGKAPNAGSCGGPGADPPAAGRFFVSFWKKTYFNTIGSHFERIQSHLKVGLLDFLTFESQLKIVS